jgi:hypothetical protein
MTVRTNIATNPGVETSLTGWTSANVALYPVTSDVSSPISGKSAMATRTATTLNTTAATFSITGQIAASGTTWIPITVGVPICVSLDIKTELADRQIRMSLNEYNSAGAFLLGTNKTTPIPFTVAGQVYRLNAVMTPTQPTAARGYLIIETYATGGGNAIVGERTWVDRLLIENAPTSDGVYFDGDTADTPTDLYAWTGASQASSSTRTTTIPATLTLGWVDSQGAVRFTVLNVPNDGLTTVKRVNPGGTLTAIRGYPDGAWHGTSGLGYDYEAPMSVWVRYAICDRDAKNLTATMVTAVIFTETPGRTNGEAWLRDVLQPVLSQPVSVVSTGDEVYVARQTVLEVAGKRTPYVVWDSRQSRQGTVVLAVRNTVVSGVWNDSTKRAKLEALFSTGRPLLLSMCANKGFRNAYLAIDSVTFTRRGTDVSWLVSLDYFEVDNPTGLGVQIVPEVTYAIAQQLPPSATYQSWAGTGIGDGILYYDVATRLSLP